MTALILVLGDQLTPSLSSLTDADPARDRILMAEVMEEATYVPHHTHKIVFLFSAMRHFADTLRESGFTVDYVKLDDAENTNSFSGEVARAVAEGRPGRLIVTEPGEHRVLTMMKEWSSHLGIPVEIRSDTRFIAPKERFATWAEGRKQLRMEYFYRDMRRETGILMQPDGSPVGGQWNFDHENRKSLPAGLSFPAPVRIEPDAITLEVAALVRDRFGHHMGDVEDFGFGVTASEAERVLDTFISERLPRFGDFQDAMAVGEDTLFHSLISVYLNAGLLDPLDVCRRTEAAWYEGSAPLNAVEGFIRQILGWREYVRGLYWLKMPDYAETNFFEADRPLPAFYWTAETDMACMAAAIDQTKRLAYAHHIQRLMITGNFALLTGIAPKEINDWYLAVYADAYEWVELPNTHGMAIYADGGIIASKPYAAGGAYIDRMSDYCRGCRYKVKQKQGVDACPFNYLYWSFLIRNREKLETNPRMGMMFRTLSKTDPAKRDAALRDSTAFLAHLDRNGTDIGFGADSGAPTEQPALL